MTLLRKTRVILCPSELFVRYLFAVCFCLMFAKPYGFKYQTQTPLFVTNLQTARGHQTNNLELLLGSIGLKRAMIWPQISHKQIK
jgi:hypothetical protein